VSVRACACVFTYVFACMCVRCMCGCGCGGGCGCVGVSLCVCLYTRVFCVPAIVCSGLRVVSHQRAHCDSSFDLACTL
jgi:hypothetical protein